MKHCHYREEDKHSALIRFELSAAYLPSPAQRTLASLSKDSKNKKHTHFEESSEENTATNDCKTNDQSLLLMCYTSIVALTALHMHLWTARRGKAVAEWVA